MTAWKLIPFFLAATYATAAAATPRYGQTLSMEYPSELFTPGYETPKYLAIQDLQVKSGHLTHKQSEYAYQIHTASRQAIGQLKLFPLNKDENEQAPFPTQDTISPSDSAVLEWYFSSNGLSVTLKTQIRRLTIDLLTYRSMGNTLHNSASSRLAILRQPDTLLYSKLSSNRGSESVVKMRIEPMEFFHTNVFPQSRTQATRDNHRNKHESRHLMLRINGEPIHADPGMTSTNKISQRLTTGIMQLKDQVAAFDASLEIFQSALSHKALESNIPETIQVFLETMISPTNNKLILPGAVQGKGFSDDVSCATACGSALAAGTAVSVGSAGTLTQLSGLFAGSVCGACVGARQDDSITIDHGSAGTAGDALGDHNWQCTFSNDALAWVCRPVESREISG